jgi:hypothetical protein
MTGGSSGGFGSAVGAASFDCPGIRHNGSIRASSFCGIFG